jgi:hypothetical protein
MSTPSVMMSQPTEERDPQVRHASSQTPPPLDPAQVELNTTLSPTRSPRSPTTTNGESHMNGRASGQPALPAEMSDYIFPDLRLKQVMDDDSKTPLVLVACGSFSPITYLHLRMFVMVADYVKFHTDFEIVGGYLSPVSDAYQKKGLASAEHRYLSSLPSSEATSNHKLQTPHVRTRLRILSLAHGRPLGSHPKRIHPHRSRPRPLRRRNQRKTLRHRHPLRLSQTRPHRSPRWRRSNRHHVHPRRLVRFRPRPHPRALRGLYRRTHGH